MLSYQHSFHAANHADLLKHSVLCIMLEKLLQKPKPFFCLDTHSGNGIYALGEPMQDENEVEKFFNSHYELTSFNTYLEIARQFQSTQQYPGSASIIPMFIKQRLFQKSCEDESKKQANQSSCQIHLNELHPSVFESLKSNMKRQNVHIHNRDGFELLNAMLPPKPNRGMVLIDPPYEQPVEYEQVLNSLLKAQKKWPQGIFALWYPLLSPHRINRKTNQIEANSKHGLSEKLIGKIASVMDTGILDVRWVKQEPNEKVGMYGSGMLLINPPYKIEESLEDLLNIFLKDGSETCQNLSYVKVLSASK